VTLSPDVEAVSLARSPRTMARPPTLLLVRYGGGEWNAAAVLRA
jgi:hypothetical protein